jgi:hypothetical protein
VHLSKPGLALTIRSSIIAPPHFVHDTDGALGAMAGNVEGAWRVSGIGSVAISKGPGSAEAAGQSREETPNAGIGRRHERRRSLAETGVVSPNFAIPIAPARHWKPSQPRALSRTRGFARSHFNLKCELRDANQAAYVQWLDRKPKPVCIVSCIGEQFCTLIARVVVARGLLERRSWGSGATSAASRKAQIIWAQIILRFASSRSRPRSSPPHPARRAARWPECRSATSR